RGRGGGVRGGGGRGRGPRGGRGGGGGARAGRGRRGWFGEDVGHVDHFDQRALQLEKPQRRGVTVVVGAGARVPDYPYRGARVGGRQGGGQHAAVGRNTGQHKRSAAGLGRQIRAPLAERGRVQRRPRLTGELVHEFIDPRVRWLQRERPLGVVRAPCPLRDLRGHEPGEGHPGPERLDQAL